MYIKLNTLTHKINCNCYEGGLAGWSGRGSDMLWHASPSTGQPRVRINK